MISKNNIADNDSNEPVIFQTGYTTYTEVAIINDDNIEIKTLLVLIIFK
jgi:hypothetical protein